MYLIYNWSSETEITMGRYPLNYLPTQNNSFNLQLLTKQAIKNHLTIKPPCITAFTITTQLTTPKPQLPTQAHNLRLGRVRRKTRQSGLERDEPDRQLQIDRLKFASRSIWSRRTQRIESANRLRRLGQWLGPSLLSGATAALD